MAERSKALVLGTSLLGGVGSNPTPIKKEFTLIFFFPGIYFFFAAHVFCCREGPGRQSELAQRKRVGLITQRSQDRNLDSLTLSRLAQLVERKTLNLVVVGSSPTVGKLLWRSWQRVGLIILRSPVRSRPGAKVFFFFFLRKKINKDKLLLEKKKKLFF